MPFTPNKPRRRMTAILLSCSLTMLPLLSQRVAQAFTPSNMQLWIKNAGGSHTHEAMTSDVISEYDVRLFGLGSQEELTDNMKKARTQIEFAVQEPDVVPSVEINLPQAHFDGEKFAASQARLIGYKLKVQELLTAEQPDVGGARKYLGHALHTLQDFYSHSNWVELGLGGPWPALGLPGSPLFDPPKETPTCNNCTRDTCAQCVNILNTDALTTGYFGTDVGDPKPSHKCSHGGLGDTSGEGAISSGINKDTNNCQFSPRSDLHDQAGRMAMAATQGYLSHLQQLVGEKRMKLLLGGGSTLAMVIDRTGSMGSVIDQVKQEAERLILDRLGTPDEPLNYVLVAFSDPEVGPVTVTDEAEEFIRALDSLEASGGGDCPEMAMSGLHLALDKMADGGELVLFTDATAKDSGQSTAVDIIALQKNVRLEKRLFGSCTASPIDPAYIRLAGDTGGQMFFLNRAEAGNITSLARFDTHPNSVNLLHASGTLSGSPRTFSLPVDSTMGRVTFSVSGTKDVAVTRPDGSPVQATDANVEAVLLSTGTVYSVVGPEAGAWQVKVNGKGVFSVKVSGESTLDFSFFHFAEEKGRPMHEALWPIDGFPLAGQRQKVMAQLSAKAGTAQFEFRAPDGTLLQKLALTEVGWANPSAAPGTFRVGNVRQYVGEAVPPATPFRVYVTGRDAGGAEYQRIIPGIVRPQTVRVVPPAPALLVPGQTTVYKFKLQNFGAAGTFNLSATDDTRFLGSVTPTMLSLAARETKEFTVVLRTPEDAGRDTLNTLTVTAQRSSSAEAFNYAQVTSLVKPASPLLLDVAAVTPAGGGGNVEPGGAVSVRARLLNVGDEEVTNIQATLTTRTPDLSITADASAYPTLVPGAAAENSTPFVVRSSRGFVCGQVLKFTLNVRQDGLSKPVALDFSARLVPASEEVSPHQTFSYAGPPAPIPGRELAGVDIPLDVSGIEGAISDLNFSFDGSACSTEEGAATPGLEHPGVGSLVVRLTSPEGTTVELMKHPGGINNTGSNFCNTVLDDQAAGRIQDISLPDAPSAGPPYSGAFKPSSPLSAFNGENPNGTWTLNVSDAFYPEGGNVRAFSLGFAGPRCGPPKADLSLRAAAPSAAPLTGSNVTYTLTVNNNGPGPARDVVVASRLPDEMTLVSCETAGGGVCFGSGNARTVSFPSLGAGASETIILVGRVNCSVADAARLTSEATVRSATHDPDETNNAATLTIAVSNPPPSIGEVTANKRELWPPNHKLVEVALNYDVSDNCGPLDNSLRVESDEPADGSGDGDTSPDWVVVDERRVRLRAERAGGGNGRTYTVTVVSKDSAGNTSTKAVAVLVPQSRP